jgi:hypothetical protein
MEGELFFSTLVVGFLILWYRWHILNYRENWDLVKDRIKIKDE